jgi:hypothetical protein
MLRLHVQCRCEFSYEGLKLSRAAGTPLDKLLRERLVRRWIEEGKGAPTLRFFFENGYKLSRNDRIPIAPGAIATQTRLIDAEPDYERRSGRETVLRQTQTFLLGQ